LGNTGLDGMLMYDVCDGKLARALHWVGRSQEGDGLRIPCEHGSGVSYIMLLLIN
jgi:hypothetical protein